MLDVTVFIDMHGVLINSRLMISNYETVLIELYKNYGISRENALEYHNKGLLMYQNLLQESKHKFLSGNEFLLEMDIADKKWDSLMQGFVTNKEATDIESRNIEFLAGSYSDSFYPDGKLFLNELLHDSQIDYFLVSNAHSKHIEGLLYGAGIKTIPLNKILGWDKIQSLKNNKIYYKTIWEKFSSTQSNKILIGNSKDEMVLGKKEGFKTIFVKREFNKNFDFKEYTDAVMDDLKSVIPTIRQILRK